MAATFAAPHHPMTAAKPLILFASGAGSNVQAIIDYFRNHPAIHPALIVCNKPQAGVLAIAEKEGIPTRMITKADFTGRDFVAELQGHNPALIVLAGFLWKIPEAMVQAFPDKIVNIHPALLPKWGGKGMYGNAVHTAVLAAGDASSGITIHYVNEVYDAGDVILQAHCPTQRGDTPDTLAGRIHRLEHFFFPRTIEFLLEEGKEA